MLLVCDIDGTLADNSHRSHFVDGEVKDWDSFLQPHLVRMDKPIPVARQALEHFVGLGNEVTFLTGRSERLRLVTTEWLFEHMGFSVDSQTLLMRPEKNFQKPTEFKRWQIQELLQRKPERKAVFVDDDPYMWTVYREFGVVLRAPECWRTLYPEAGELLPEVAMRK